MTDQAHRNERQAAKQAVESFLAKHPTQAGDEYFFSLGKMVLENYVVLAVFRSTVAVKQSDGRVTTIDRFPPYVAERLALYGGQYTSQIGKSISVTAHRGKCIVEEY